MRLTIRFPDPTAPGLPRMLCASVVAHAAAAVAALLVPGLLPRSSPPRWDAVMIGSLVELPPAGGPMPGTPTSAEPAPAEPAAASAPAAEPAPPPPPEPKPRQQAEPAAKPKPAKPKPQAKPAEARPAAAAGPAAESPAGDVAQATPSGAAGAGAGGSAGPGIGLSIGGQGKPFPHAYYAALVQNKLQANFAEPVHPGQGEGLLSVRVTFNLSRNGQVSGVAVAIPSPYPALDSAALRAVYQSSPFPPLPPAYTGDSIELAVTFTLNPVGL